MAKLALFGGEKTVTLSAGPWPRIGDEEIEAVTSALRQANEDSRGRLSHRCGRPLLGGQPGTAVLPLGFAHSEDYRVWRSWRCSVARRRLR
jgi:hypothetical protein